eukprot:12325475-Alexandrium_andersonii.AAC.1
MLAMGGNTATRPFAELVGLSMQAVSRLALSLLPARADRPLRRVTACADSSFGPRTGEAAGAAVLVGLATEAA